MYNKSSPKDVEIIRNPDIDPTDVDGISTLEASMMGIGSDQLYEFEPEIAGFLDHPASIVRSRAIRILLYRWSMEKYLDRAIQMLRNDPRFSGRTSAARTLADYTEDHREKKEYILEVLVKALLSDHKDLDEGDEVYVQAACWESIVNILNDHSGPSYFAPDPFDLKKDVDWELIKPYMDEEHVQEQ